MNYAEIFAPIALFLGVVVLAAAVYFVVTWIRGRAADRRAGERPDRRGRDGRGSHMR